MELTVSQELQDFLVGNLGPLWHHIQIHKAIPHYHSHSVLHLLSQSLLEISSYHVCNTPAASMHAMHCFFEVVKSINFVNNVNDDPG